MPTWPFASQEKSEGEEVLEWKKSFLNIKNKLKISIDAAYKKLITRNQSFLRRPTWRTQGTGTWPRSIFRLVNWQHEFTVVIQLQLRN